MDVERWRRIEALYHAADARPQNERTAFVRQACAGDEALAREVLALLDQPASAGAFFAQPAAGIAAPLLTDESALLGRRIGGYEIVSRIGAGGMGEVYRARDTRLGRDVAIKILPRAFTSDPDRLARFEREARVLASLNHPNIATIHGVEDADGVRAIVMELVDGDTLADRLASLGASHKFMPVREALAIARQVADGLDAAHEKGIVHRDLNPANIAITRDGVVKVLDFGLAKAVAGAPGGEPGAPTFTVDRTAEGLLLGTVAYMSPEQARGQVVDKRTDIWAFGCVLYEMLTGRGAFKQETVTDTLAAVIEREPDWSAVPDATPSAIVRLLHRCLEKDPKRRLRDIGDARHDCDLLADEDTAVGGSGRRKVGALAVALAITGAAVVGFVAFTLMRPPGGPAPVVSRLVISLPSGDDFRARGRQIVDVSPDGRQIVYAANRRLYLRPLTQLDGMPIAGTEPPPDVPIARRTDGSALNPSFSPDGQWIAFSQNGQLKKVPATGGSAVVLASGYEEEPYSVRWQTDGTILIVDCGLQGEASGIWRVPESGGPPTLLIPHDRSDVKSIPISPQRLPGGDLLVTELNMNRPEQSEIVVRSPRSGTRQVIQHGLAARYLKTGHLIYGLRSTLLAVRFDSRTHQVSDVPVPVLPDVAQESAAGAWGGLVYAVSDTGTLVYLSQSALTPRRVPVWVDRQGRDQPLGADQRAYEYPRFSPDGQQIAFDTRDQQGDIWTWDVARATLTRVTFDRRAAGPPVWTPDGRAIVSGFADADERVNLFRQSVTADARPERLVTSKNFKSAFAFSPDGRGLVFQESDPRTNIDLWLLSTETGATSTLLSTPFNEQNPDISPDGRWLAYQSDESGRGEVYVRPFPNVKGGRWQVSTSGATRPLWSRDGRELFYLDADRRLTTVSVQTAPHFANGPAITLFETKRFGVEGIARNFDIAPDGRRFVFIKNLPTPADARRLVIVLNWSEELKQRVPTR